MRAGRLDRRITIERKSLSYSDSGEPQETWSALASRISASWGAVKGEERFSSEQYVSREQVEFRVRWQSALADLSPVDRIVYPAQGSDSPDAPATRILYNIIEVHEIGRREGLQIIAARLADAAS